MVSRVSAWGWASRSPNASATSSGVTWESPARSTSGSRSVTPTAPACPGGSVSAARSASWKAVPKPARPPALPATATRPAATGASSSTRTASSGRAPGDQAVGDARADVPVGDQALPVEPVLDRTDHVGPLAVGEHHHAGDRVVRGDTEGRPGPGGVRRVASPAVDQAVEDGLLALLVAALHPVPLAVVGLDEHGVLDVEVGPHPAGGASRSASGTCSCVVAVSVSASHSTRAPIV